MVGVFPSDDDDSSGPPSGLQGNCPDNSYPYTSFAKTPTTTVCSQRDSFIDPHTDCQDEAARAINCVLLRLRIMWYKAYRTF
jgi:hypothetical protein